MFRNLTRILFLGGWVTPPYGTQPHSASPQMNSVEHDSETFMCFHGRLRLIYSLQADGLRLNKVFFFFLIQV